MWGKIFLATILLVIVLISGCTTENKALFVEASNNLSQNFLELYEDYSEMLHMVQHLPPEIYTPLFSEVCPVEEFLEDDELLFYVYYLDGCDFLKLGLLRESDDYTDSFNYLGLCLDKAHIIMTDKEYSAISELYNEEKVTADDSMEDIGKDATNKIIDTLAYAYEITIDMFVYGYTGNKLSDECYESASCADSLFQKFEAAIPELTGGTKFDDSYLVSCKDYFQNIDEENSIGILKEQLGELFKEVGYAGDVDNYISYDSICQRFRTVYSRFYEGILDDVDEPTQKYIIAATFFGLSNFHEDRESFNSSMDQIIG